MPAAKGMTQSREYLRRYKEIEQQYHSDHPKYSVAKVRNRVEAIVEDKVWTLWAYVRENREKLDSTRICNFIRSAITLAVKDVEAELESMRSDNEKLDQQVKELKETIKEMRKEYREAVSR